MTKFKIVYTQFLDNCGKNFMIGGVETYIRNLIPVIQNRGYEVEIYQISNISFVKEISGAKIIGVSNNKKEIKISDLVLEASKNADYDNDILLFATDLHIVNSKFKRVMAIQHGLAWDVTDNEKYKDISNYFSIFKGMLRAIIKYNRYKKCSDLICVDYNFINWYRTQIKHICTNICVIPNFTEIPSNIIRKKDNVVISIIFARRFYEYRGTRIFTEAIENIINKFDDIKITIAGEGPDEEWLRSKLQKYNNIDFVKYDANDSIKIHMQHDIAVVPSRGSEGTSLALLEAMASGCAVVSTYVGGLSNIILDGYNGLIAEPNSQSIEIAIEKLISDKNFRKFVSKNGFETVKNSFSLERWENDWVSVIENTKKLWRK